MFQVKVDTMDPSLSNSSTMALLNATADHGRQGQAAHRRYRQTTLYVTLISSKDSAHDFIVKFSPSVYVTVVASLTRSRDVAVRSCLPCSWNKSCCYPWYDKTFNQQCMLAQARPPMIIILLVHVVASDQKNTVPAWLMCFI